VLVVIELVRLLDGRFIWQDDRILVLNVIDCSVAGAFRLICRDQKSLLLFLRFLLLLIVGVVSMAIIVVVLSGGFGSGGWGG